MIKVNNLSKEFHEQGTSNELLAVDHVDFTIQNSSGEDYLKAIFILEARHGSVRSVEVAEYMNVSKASVNHAVRHTRNQAHYFE